MKSIHAVMVCWLGIQGNPIGAAPIESGNDKPPVHAETRGANRHWAFVPPIRPGEPRVNQKEWPRNPIDNFILARLEKEKITPSPEADRVTLVRRLNLDLLGLPPAMAEVDAFVNDTRPGAYGRLVERLLASPHFGERWGRQWLDVARYADSNGYSIDAPRAIWKYRDWVIDALNRDLPFDQFVVWQLAGDLLPEATMEQKIATGFHRNTQINEEGGIDKEQFRIESIIDRVNTTGTAFLGLTIGCCQCHDHKFDPLKQKEYYRLFAFLNNADEPVLEIGSPEELARRDALRAQIKTIEADLERHIDSFAEQEADWEKNLADAERRKLRFEIQKILEKPLEKRDRKEKQAVFEAFRGNDEAYRERKQRIARLQKSEPGFLTTMILKEREQPRETYVFIKGDFTRHGEVVTPGVPAVLHPLAKSEHLNRLDLARWIVDPRNPLTARVTVNRIWQQYFGKWLVETENDFGTQGAPPTHPELLDWLASEFMAADESGRPASGEPERSAKAPAPSTRWSLKRIHRLIVTSATYRQSSRARPELDRVDPGNKLLARQNRLRLDAEVVRDVALSASGLLNDKIGGPSVHPPQPDGVMTLGQSRREWKADTGPDRYRRGLYTFFWRATPHPALAVFDAPDAFSACTRRIRSNTPLQALTLLNDQAFFEFAQGLAARVVREGPRNDAGKIDYAFRLCLARSPGAYDQKRLADLLAKALAADEGTEDERQLAAWTTVARVLLNLDETITRE